MSFSIMFKKSFEFIAKNWIYFMLFLAVFGNLLFMIPVIFYHTPNNDHLQKMDKAFTLGTYDYYIVLDNSDKLDGKGIGKLRNLNNTESDGLTDELTDKVTAKKKEKLEHMVKQNKKQTETLRNKKIPEGQADLRNIEERAHRKEMTKDISKVIQIYHDTETDPDNSTRNNPPRKQKSHQKVQRENPNHQAHVDNNHSGFSDQNQSTGKQKRTDNLKEYKTEDKATDLDKLGENRAAHNSNQFKSGRPKKARKNTEKVKAKDKLNENDETNATRIEGVAKNIANHQSSKVIVKPEKVESDNDIAEVDDLSERLSKIPDHSNHPSLKQSNDNAPNKNVKKSNDNVPNKTVKTSNDNAPKKSVKKSNDNVPNKTVKTSNDNVPNKSVKKTNDNAHNKSVKKSNDNVPNKSVKTSNDNVPNKSVKKSNDNAPIESVKKTEDNQNETTVKESEAQSFLTIYPPKGQLGCQLFQLATLLGQAAKFNYTAFFPMSGFSINSVFILPYDFYKNIPRTNFQTVRQAKYLRPDKTEVESSRYRFLEELDHRRNWTLDGYFQSFKYFDHVKDKIRQYLRFKKKHIHNAKAVVDMVREGHVKVAVHVRRQDYNSKDQIYLGRVAAPSSYIKKAMQYFQKRFETVTFLVVSDDIQWCKCEIRLQFEMIFSQSEEAGTDLAIMSMCDHAIITGGSFGWWGGWLTEGEVVYYSGHPRKNSELGRNYEMDDYYPSSWIGME